MSRDEVNADIPHPGGDWVKIRLTALEQDVLWYFINEFQQLEDSEIQPVLDDILDKLPEHAITTRPPSMEALIKMGYFDREITERKMNAPVIVEDDS